MKYTKELLEEVVKNNNCIKDCLIELGIQEYTNHYIRKLIKKYNINTDHFLTKKELLSKSMEARGGWGNNKWSLEEILVKDFKGNISGTNIKKKLYKASLKQPICELCGQNENWKTGKISMILDHVNGSNRDNRIENLRIVCPNCNATLPTHAGKNNRRYKENQKLKENKLLEKQKSKEENIKNWESKIKEANINFNKKTWGVEVSKVMGYSSTHCLKFIKKNLSYLL